MTTTNALKPRLLSLFTMSFKDATVVPIVDNDDNAAAQQSLSGPPKPAAVEVTHKPQAAGERSWLRSVVLQLAKAVKSKPSTSLPSNQSRSHRSRAAVAAAVAAARNAAATQEPHTVTTVDAAVAETPPKNLKTNTKIDDSSKVVSNATVEPAVVAAVKAPLVTKKNTKKPKKTVSKRILPKRACRAVSPAVDVEPEHEPAKTVTKRTKKPKTIPPPRILPVRACRARVAATVEPVPIIEKSTTKPKPKKTLSKKAAPKKTPSKKTASKTIPTKKNPPRSRKQPKADSTPKPQPALHSVLRQSKYGVPSVDRNLLQKGDTNAERLAGWESDSDTCPVLRFSSYEKKTFKKNRKWRMRMMEDDPNSSPDAIDALDVLTLKRNLVRHQVKDTSTLQEFKSCINEKGKCELVLVYSKKDKILEWTKQMAELETQLVKTTGEKRLRFAEDTKGGPMLDDDDDEEWFPGGD